MGNVDSVQVMHQGTPEDVERESLECVKKAGAKGGFILSGDCELPPGIPVQNLRAMEAVGKAAIYPLGF
jgi:uroporphyrinogen decarboxylase